MSYEQFDLNRIMEAENRLLKLLAKAKTKGKMKQVELLYTTRALVSAMDEFQFITRANLLSFLHEYFSKLDGIDRSDYHLPHDAAEEICGGVHIENSSYGEGIHIHFPYEFYPRYTSVNEDVSFRFSRTGFKFILTYLLKSYQNQYGKLPFYDEPVVLFYTRTSKDSNPIESDNLETKSAIDCLCGVMFESDQADRLWTIYGGEIADDPATEMYIFERKNISMYLPMISPRKVV